jgi:hypothetical protein
LLKIDSSSSGKRFKNAFISRLNWLQVEARKIPKRLNWLEREGRCNFDLISLKFILGKVKSHEPFLLEMFLHRRHNRSI